jgi:hypothetical protein
VATAYRTDERVDNTVEAPGQLLLFDVASALPIRELTTGARDLYPSFSPDDNKVIFERSGRVRTIAVNGGPVKRVVRGIQPTWGR